MISFLLIRSGSICSIEHHSLVLWIKVRVVARVLWLRRLVALVWCAAHWLLHVLLLTLAIAASHTRMHRVLLLVAWLHTIHLLVLLLLSCEAAHLLVLHAAHIRVHLLLHLWLWLHF